MHRGLRGARVTKEMLVHKAPRVILMQKVHLIVVVLGLRVLRVAEEILQHKDQKEISVLRVQKVMKEMPVVKVLRVIKMTLMLEVEKVIKYVDTIANILSSSETFEGGINMNNNRIKNSHTPTSNDDAVNKVFVRIYREKK